MLEERRLSGLVLLMGGPHAGSDIVRKCIACISSRLSFRLPCRRIEHPLHTLLDNVVLLFCEIDVRRGTDNKFVFQAIVMDLKNAKATTGDGVDEDLSRKRYVSDDNSSKVIDLYRISNIFLTSIEFH